MKSVAISLEEIEKELQERMMWINRASALMRIVVEHGMNEPTKKMMKTLIDESEMK